MAKTTREKVFISYSHDSPAHAERVLSLSERLRRDGIETQLDQYVNGTPVERWPRWMLNQLDWAEFVLLVCTETYYRRFRGHEAPGKGKGVDWEGAIITQEIYDDRSKTTKFVSVLFDSADEPFIPEPVRGHTRYVLNSEQAYQALYDFLLNQAGIEPCPVGDPKRKPRQQAKPLTFDDAGSDPTPLPKIDSPVWDDEKLVKIVRNEIRKLLDDSKGHPLRNEIVKEAGGASADEVLVPPKFSSAVDLLKRLHRNTESCLSSLTVDKPAMIKLTKAVAEQVLGWLILLGIDSDAVKSSGCMFDPRKEGIQIAIPLKTEAGTEVLIARLSERAARWKITGSKWRRVVGKDAFTADALESGPGSTEPLTDIYRRIWVELEKSDPPSEYLRERLDAKLKGREERKEGHFYITIPHTLREYSVLADPQLLRDLLDTLPSLRVFSIGSAEGTKLMFKNANEFVFEDYIEAFLRLLGQFS